MVRHFCDMLIQAISKLTRGNEKQAASDARRSWRRTRARRDRAGPRVHRMLSFHGASSAHRRKRGRKPLLRGYEGEKKEILPQECVMSKRSAVPVLFFLGAFLTPALVTAMPSIGSTIILPTNIGAEVRNVHYRRYYHCHSTFDAYRGRWRRTCHGGGGPGPYPGHYARPYRGPYPGPGPMPGPRPMPGPGAGPGHGPWPGPGPMPGPMPGPGPGPW
jgi:hypothetical protein